MSGTVVRDTSGQLSGTTGQDNRGSISPVLSQSGPAQPVTVDASAEAVSIEGPDAVMSNHVTASKPSEALQLPADVPATVPVAPPTAPTGETLAAQPARPDAPPVTAAPSCACGAVVRDDGRCSKGHVQPGAQLRSTGLAKPRETTETHKHRVRRRTRERLAADFGTDEPPPAVQSLAATLSYAEDRLERLERRSCQTASRDVDRLVDGAEQRCADVAAKYSAAVLAWKEERRTTPKPAPAPVTREQALARAAALMHQTFLSDGPAFAAALSERGVTVELPNSLRVSDPWPRVTQPATPAAAWPEHLRRVRSGVIEQTSTAGVIEAESIDESSRPLRLPRDMASSYSHGDPAGTK